MSELREEDEISQLDITIDTYQHQFGTIQNNRQKESQTKKKLVKNSKRRKLNCRSAANLKSSVELRWAQPLNRNWVQFDVRSRNTTKKEE